MKQMTDFIMALDVKPADSFLIRGPSHGFIDRYLVYLGSHGGREIFMINETTGTRFLYDAEVNQYLQDTPVYLKKFTGNDLQRKSVVRMALGKGDVESYYIIRNNCERTVALYKKHKPAYSQEVNLAGTGLALGGLALAAASRNSGIRGIGILMAILGLIAIATADND